MFSEGLGGRKTWPRTLAYGAAHYGKSLFWTASELLLAFFLTEVGALAPAQMGGILATGLAASAVADVAVGVFVRRRLASVAAAVRLQFFGAVASSAAMLAMFASYWFPTGGRAAFALGVGLCFRLGYALYDLPQNALVSLATSDGAGRTNVVAVRYVFSGLASLTVASLVAPFLLAGPADLRAVNFFALIAAFSFVAIVSAAVLVRALRPMANLDLRTPPGPPARERRQGAIALLIGLMFVESMAAPVFSKIEPYYAAYVLRNTLLSGGVLTGVALGTSVSQPFWVWACRGLSRPLAICVTASAVVLSAFLFLAFGAPGRWAPPLSGAIFGAASAGLGMAMWAAFGDAVASGARGREAISFAAFTAASKASLALGVLLIGAFLSAVDYRGENSRVLIVAMSAPPIFAGALCAVIAAIWALRRRAGARYVGEGRIAS